jgi:hypothetical protein
MKLLESFIKDSLFEYFLIEGIYDIAKKKYVDSGKLDLDTFEYLRQKDPSQKNKYLDWMAKQLSNDLGLDPKYLIELIEQFHNNQKKLEKRDINQYKTAEDLVNGLNQAEKMQGQQRATTRQAQYVDLEPGTKLIYKDDKYIILLPLTKNAVCHYGAGTKWCITQGSEERNVEDMYEGYSSDNTIFYYILDLTRKSKDPLYKVAISAERNEDNQFVGIEAHNAEDKYLNKKALMSIYGDFWEKLYSIIQTNASQQPATEEYEIKLKRTKMKMLYNELDAIIVRFIGKSNILYADLKKLEQNDEEFVFKVVITGQIESPTPNSASIYRSSSDPHKLSNAISKLSDKEYISYIKNIINNILDEYSIDKIQILEKWSEQEIHPTISFRVGDNGDFSEIDGISNIKDSLSSLLEKDLSRNKVLLLLEQELINDGKIENWLGKDDLENLQMKNLYFEYSVKNNKNVLEIGFLFTKKISEEEHPHIQENKYMLSYFSKKIEKYANDIYNSRGDEIPLELEVGIPNGEFRIGELGDRAEFVFDINHEHDVERGIFWSKFLEDHADFVEKTFNDYLSKALS